MEGGHARYGFNPSNVPESYDNENRPAISFPSFSTSSEICMKHGHQATLSLSPALPISCEQSLRRKSQHGPTSPLFYITEWDENRPFLYITEWDEK